MSKLPALPHPEPVKVHGATWYHDQCQSTPTDNRFHHDLNQHVRVDLATSRLGEPRSLIDIAVVAGLVYWLLWVAQGTRATQLLRGALIFLVAAVVLARTLDLTTLTWMMDHMWPALIVAIPVLFQPELRRALEQLGHTDPWLRTSLPATANNEQIGLANSIDEIVRSAAQLSRLRYGALIVIERETGLQDYADRGIALDAVVSRQLLVTIFFPNSPLHDAAALIRDTRIVAASVVLPLTDNISAMSNLGTQTPSRNRSDRGFRRPCRSGIGRNGPDFGGAPWSTDTQSRSGSTAPCLADIEPDRSGRSQRRSNHDAQASDRSHSLPAEQGGSH